MQTKQTIINELISKDPNLNSKDLSRKTKASLNELLKFINSKNNSNPVANSLVEELQEKFPIEGLSCPQSNPNFYLSQEVEDLLTLIYQSGLDPNRPPINCLIKGPQGCGKTETVVEFAARFKLPILTINCSMVREPRDWFGYKSAKDGSVFWIKSQFSEAVSRGGVVICLDEITRANPVILNSLLSLMDDTRRCFVEEEKEILHCGPMVYFFATANIGSQFTGTYGRLDAALDDRFGLVVASTFLPAEREIEILVNVTGVSKEEATKFVKIANTIRNESINPNGGKVSKAISTRTLIGACRAFKLMGPSGIEFSLVTRFDEGGGADSEQSFVRATIQSQFGSTRAI